MAKKDSARGEAWSRWVAARLGGRRRQKGETANGHDDIVEVDGQIYPISIECKAYATLQLRTAWVEQARRNSKGRHWVIAQRPKGWRNPVVTIDFMFFEELLESSGYITTNQKELDVQEVSSDGLRPGTALHRCD